MKPPGLVIILEFEVKLQWGKHILPVRPTGDTHEKADHGAPKRVVMPLSGLKVAQGGLEDDRRTGRLLLPHLESQVRQVRILWVQEVAVYCLAKEYT